MRYAHILMVTLAVCTSCRRSAEQKKQQAESPDITELKKGEVIAAVPLVRDPTQSYALYLPSFYSDTSLLPAIIFFDPHGDGSLPVHLYDTFAERYGFVLIGSNNSKNGLPLVQTNQIAANLLSEVKTRFKINKISLCGFSGGAKVALTYASLNAEISHVIYCGAVSAVKPRHDLTFLGFAGVRDMNYGDLIAFHHSLDNTSQRHLLIEWKGKHEFPDPATFEDAFIFLETGEVPAYASKQPKITPQKLTQEQNLKQKYYEAFASKDLPWWEDEIRGLHSLKSQDLMYERLLGFISLACYSYVSQAINEGRITFAERMLVIYRLADPNNEDMLKFSKDVERMKL